MNYYFEVMLYKPDLNQQYFLDAYKDFWQKQKKETEKLNRDLVLNVLNLFFNYYYYCCAEWGYIVAFMKVLNNISNISYLNSPSPPFSFSLPPLPLS
jgi:hypothetical protein